VCYIYAIELVLRRPVESAEYTAASFQAACTRLNIRPSMGRVGSALDNAVIESWHSTLEFELRRLERFPTKAAARADVAGFIDEYNRDRRHSALSMTSPINYELTWRASQIPDTGPNKVRPGTEDDQCENGAESSRLSSRTRPRRW
jgi:hypothetical protein